MPPKVKSVKNNVGGHYRPKKRKAFSPLEASRHFTSTRTSEASLRVDKHINKHNGSDQSTESNKSPTNNHEVKSQKCYFNPPHYTCYSANMNNMS